MPRFEYENKGGLSDSKISEAAKYEFLSLKLGLSIYEHKLRTGCN